MIMTKFLKKFIKNFKKKIKKEIKLLKNLKKSLINTSKKLNRNYLKKLTMNWNSNVL